MRWLLVLLAAACALPVAAAEPAAEPLWQIDAKDGDNGKFALAPAGYAQFEHDGLFVVGQSEARTAWPYVHPGPADSWAGSMPHTFSVVFGLAETIATGDARLAIELLDTHSTAPPHLRIEINGHPLERALAAGAGDASVYGEPQRGRPQSLVVDFPAAWLTPGNNQLDIHNIQGSWLLYDSLALEAPAGVKPATVAPFTALRSVKLRPGRTPANQRRLAIAMAHVGPPVTATVKLDDNAAGTFELHGGLQEIDFPVPAVDKARPVVVAVAVGERDIGYQTVVLTPGLERVIVVFKTHFDIGYTDMAAGVVERYRTTMIDQALDVCDQNRDLPPAQQFTWTIPGWPMHKIMEDWPGQTPARRQRLEAALREGRFVVHALPFTTHTELLEAEDLVRGLGYSSRLARGLGLELPRDAKMTDVPEHAWILPTLLSRAGVEFLHLGCNGMSAPLRVPDLFWWEGPDGARLLTMYSTQYGTGLAAPPDWPYRTWLALIHTGDNHGPPRPEEVKAVLRQAAQELPGVDVRIGRLADFGAAIVAEKADLPVVRGDAPDTWIHGPMSDPIGAKLARNLRPRLAALESLNTLLRAWDIDVPDASPAVADAYQQSLLYGEHTWGGSIGWIGGPLSFGDDFLRDRAGGRFARSEASWEEHSQYIRTAETIAEPALAANLATLGQSVAVGGPRIVVYNPLPWTRDDLVCLASAGEFAALKPVDDDEIVPVEKTAGGIRFVARGVPGLGYRSFVPVKAELEAPPWQVDAAAGTLETPQFKITLDTARGVVRSLVEKATEREWVDAAAPHGFGQFLYERFDRDQVLDYCRAYVRHGPPYHADFDKPGMPPAAEVAYQAASPGGFTLAVEEGSVSLTAVMHAAEAKPCPVTTRVVVYRDLPWVDVEMTLHDKPLEPWPEAGWLALPIKAAEPQFRLARLGAIVDPVSDTLPGTNRHLFGLNGGLAIAAAGGAGVGLCAVDHPLVSLDSPGCWKYSLDFVPQRPTAYVNLFNNQWNTNFRLWNGGTWTSRVRLWGFAAYAPEPVLITPSWQARWPLLAVMADGAAGSLPASRRGIELSTRGAIVTALGKNPDGAGTLVRLWEHAGHTGECRVQLPEGLSASNIEPVNLRGQPGGPAIPVVDGSATVPLPAFAPTSFVVHEEEKR